MAKQQPSGRLCGSAEQQPAFSLPSAPAAVAAGSTLQPADTGKRPFIAVREEKIKRDPTKRWALKAQQQMCQMTYPKQEELTDVINSAWIKKRKKGQSHKNRSQTDKSDIQGTLCSFT